MLERTSSSTEPGAEQPRVIVVESPAKSIDGRALVQLRTRLKPRELARLAAQWVRGSLPIDHPTITTAAVVFGTCTQLIAQELHELELTAGAVPPRIDALWKALPTIEKNAFVRRNLISIWDSVDAVTR